QRAYYANIKTQEIHCITKIQGTHVVKIGQNGKYFIDSYSSVTVPKEYNILDLQGRIVKNILIAKDPLTEYNMPKARIFTIKAADNKEDLYVRMITPPNMDKSKKYPVIVYVYGGPHAQLITNSWLGGAQMWLYYMAQKGYICFTVDNRGSYNRGLAFENVIHRNLGQNEMKDQMEGIKYLKTLPYVDTNRIGVFGWSFGGFMTTSLMLNYPETFKVGVAGGPVIDWKYYEIMYGERYMDMPEENVDGYKKTSLLDKEKIKRLKGRKILLIQGAVDKTVVWQHSLRFIQECVKANVPVDFFVYPLAEHNVRGYDRIHLMDKITTYFDDYLKNYYKQNGK
ncbi:MAG TPA: S9 family peptidase, partial [Bacteroidales bacterium]|nr:S9 family peptidase [Bacteroidales bacterium]